MVKMSRLYFVVFALSFSINIFAYSDMEVLPNQWEMRREMSVYKLIHDKDGKLISTSTLIGPGERSDVLILYIQTNKDLYRCVDFVNKSFQATGFMCYQLVDPKR